MSKHEVGRRLLQRVVLVNAAQAAKITGMLLELAGEELCNLLTDDTALLKQINNAVQSLHQAGVDGRDAAAAPGDAADATAAAAIGTGANTAAGEAGPEAYAHAADAPVRDATKSPRGQ